LGKELDHPYELEGGKWLRGNLHCHPRPREIPFDVAVHYRKLGYGFVVLTEHDHFYSTDDIDSWDNQGLVLIPGNEITKDGPHILHIGADRRIEPDENRQKVIDQINSSSGFAVMNHPNLSGNFDSTPMDCLRKLQGYQAIEIYNDGGARGVGNPYATDKWDMLLTEGRRIWGIATDDYHGPLHAGNGWVMAYVQHRDRDGILEALQRGRFYASTGIRIDRIEVEGLYVRIEASNAQHIAASIEHGRTVATTDSSVLEVPVPPDATYVRFECWGTGRSQAWTQPFWVRDGEKD